MPRRTLAFIAVTVVAVAILYAAAKLFGFDLGSNALFGVGLAGCLGALGAAQTAPPKKMRPHHPAPELVIGRTKDGVTSARQSSLQKRLSAEYWETRDPSVASGGKAPPPAPPDALQTLEQWLREAFSHLAQGYLDLVYKKKMYLDDSQDIKIRIREQTRAPLRRDLDAAADELRIEETKVAPIMSVTLESAHFDIQPEGEATRALFLGDATWIFHVTPRSGGTHPIRIMAAAVLKPPDYTEKLTYIPVSDISVDVRVHYLKKTTRTILSGAWKAVLAVLGAAVAAFFASDQVKKYMLQLYNAYLAPRLGLPPIPLA